MNKRKVYLEAVLAVQDIEKVKLYNRTEQKAHEFATYVTEKYSKNEFAR